MKILMTTNNMGYLSGAPLYVFTMAQELAKEHDVTVSSSWEVVGTDGEKLKSILESKGVKCITGYELEYDLILASEWCPDIKGKKVNIVHSEYDCETPLNGMDYWIAIRPSIQDHIFFKHDIPYDKIHVIYNGIDRDRFTKRAKPDRDYKLTVVPCTKDPLRKRFIEHLCSISSKDNRYDFYGDDYGTKITGEYCRSFPAKFDIEKEIGEADEVAGILLGRVNLEASSCGVKSVIYNPNTLETEEFLLSEEEFDARHNIKNVVKQILSI